MCAVAETLSIDGFKELTNVNNELIIRFLESRLALLILHHRFVSNLFIYSVIEDEGTICDYYEGVGEELTTCIIMLMESSCFRKISFASGIESRFQTRSDFYCHPLSRLKTKTIMYVVCGDLKHTNRIFREKPNNYK